MNSLTSCCNSRCNSAGSCAISTSISASADRLGIRSVSNDEIWSMKASGSDTISLRSLSTSATVSGLALGLCVKKRQLHEEARDARTFEAWLEGNQMASQQEQLASGASMPRWSDRAMKQPALAWMVSNHQKSNRYDKNRYRT